MNFDKISVDDWSWGGQIYRAVHNLSCLS